ncbi:hypothetical protein M3J09_001761 [Ascochyta lentis]
MRLVYQEFGTELRERVRLPVDSRTNGHTERLLTSQPPTNRELFDRAISAVEDVWWTYGVLVGHTVCLKLSRNNGCASASHLLVM